MTQEDLTQALNNGKATVEQPAQGSDTSEGTSVSGASQQPVEKPDNIEQYLPLLMALQSVQRWLTSAPTLIPKTFQEQLQFVYDGTTAWLYLWINNAWQKISMGTTVNQIIAGTGISISPGGGTGAVTITSNNPMPSYTLVGFNGSYLYQDTSTGTTDNSTPTKIHEIQFPAGMPTTTFSVTYSFYGGFTGSPSQQALGQIFKNGSAYGTQRTATPNTTTPSSFTETLSFSGGDYCQLYLWYAGTNLGSITYSNFGLAGIPIPNYLIPTKLS